VKFNPIASNSPKIESKEMVYAGGFSPIELMVIDDPKNSQPYLSVGIGTSPVRRTWLTPEQAAKLIEKIAILTPKLWR
jgi:hypothetical protein